MEKLKKYLHQHFGLDAGHAIMALVLSIIALTTTSIYTNIIVATGISLFFVTVIIKTDQSLLKNVLFSLGTGLSVFIALTMVLTLDIGQYFHSQPFFVWPKMILPAILAGSFSYMIPKEIYDMTTFPKFRLHIDNITDAISYQLLSWPILFMLGGYPVLAVSIMIFWLAVYFIALLEKLKI